MTTENKLPDFGRGEDDCEESHIWVHEDGKKPQLMRDFDCCSNVLDKNALAEFLRDGYTHNDFELVNGVLMFTDVSE